MVPLLTETDIQWARVCRLIPAPNPDGRPAKYGCREILKAPLYVARTGCQWRDLPHEFPPWEAVYWCFRFWNKDGTLGRLMAELRATYGKPKVSEPTENKEGGDRFWLRPRRPAASVRRGCFGDAQDALAGRPRRGPPRGPLPGHPDPRIGPLARRRSPPRAFRDGALRPRPAHVIMAGMWRSPPTRPRGAAAWLGRSSTSRRAP
jgi:transposase